MKYNPNKKFESDFKYYRESKPKRLASSVIDAYEQITNNSGRGIGYQHIRMVKFYLTHDSEFQLTVKLHERKLVESLYDRGMKLEDIKRYLEL